MAVSWARGGLVETALAVCDRAVRQNRRHPSYWLRVLPFLARKNQRAEQGFDVVNVNDVILVDFAA